MQIFKVFFSISDVVDTVIIIVSLIGCFVTFYDFIRGMGKNRRWLWYVAICLIFSLCLSVLILSIARKNYVTVPDVVGHEYKNASLELNNVDLLVEQYVGNSIVVSSQSPMAGDIVKRKSHVKLSFDNSSLNKVIVPSVVGYSYENASLILNNMGLRCSVIAKNAPQYIVEQQPEAGVIIEEGSMVEVETDSIGNRPELVEAWEQALDVDFSRLEMKLKNTEVSVEGFADGTRECYGTYIDDFIVEDLYLLEPDSGVEYHDFEINGDTITMERIPIGINFVMHLLVSGYEEVEEEIVLSRDVIKNGVLEFDQFLDKIGDNASLNTTFYVKDSEGNAMKDLRIYIAWEKENYWGGNDYTTTEEGRFKYYIFLSEDRTVGVWIVNPFGNGVDYMCDVTLRYPQIGMSMYEDIIILNMDGSCKVMSEEEYFEG